MIYFSTKWLDVRTLGLLSNSSCPFSNDIPPNEGCMCYIMTAKFKTSWHRWTKRQTLVQICVYIKLKRSVWCSPTQTRLLWRREDRPERNTWCADFESLTSRTKSITHKAGKARQVEADWQHSRTEHQCLLTEELILPSACLRRANERHVNFKTVSSVSIDTQKRQQRTVGHQNQGRIC